MVQGQLLDPKHLNELGELLHTLLDRLSVGRQNHGHALNLGVLGFAHREGGDVEASAREESRHARENTGFVLWTRLRGSSPVVGSSRKMTSGLATRAAA